MALDEVKPGRSFGITATMMAWAVLFVGLAIAVVGTVQAMRTAGDEPAAAPVETQALGKQIEQLKIELDRERSEKQDLLQKLAAIQAQTESSAGAGSSMPKSEANAGDEPAPAAAPVPSSPEPAAQAPPPTPPPQSSLQALPEPMAPSAELLEPSAPPVAEVASVEQGCRGE